MSHIKYEELKKEFNQNKFHIKISHNGGVEKFKDLKASIWYKRDGDLFVQWEDTYIFTRYEGGSVTKIKINGTDYDKSDIF